MTSPFLNLAAIHPRSLKSLAGYLSGLVEGRLWLKVLIAMALGLITGFAIGPAAGLVEPGLGSLIGHWLALPGLLFLAAVQMIVMPLVFASIIVGLASSEDIDQLRRVGIIVVLFFVATTAFAATLGIVLASIVQPGRGLATEIVAAADSAAAAAPLATPTLAQVPETIIRLLPANPLSSMAEGEMLQVVIFAVVVGLALVALPPAQSRPMLDLLSSLQQVCMTVVRWAMRLAPLAVFGFMARLTSQSGLEALLAMGVYVATVLAGLLVMLGVYLLLIRLFAGRAPGAFLRATRELLLLAFSTSSSAAVMPLSIKTAEEKLDIEPALAQFVIPLGATINMNGTALYQGVAAVFLAQVYGIDIGFSGMALIVALAVGASIGSPGTPGVGIVILATVLGTVGIPPEGVALLIGVDRILDMSRTAVNVAGDLAATTLLSRWVGSRPPAAPRLA